MIHRISLAKRSTTMTQHVDPDRLKQLRTLQHWSQKQLAEKARRLNQQTIYRLEKGDVSNIRKTTIEKLCKALGVEADVLSGKKPIPIEYGPTGEPHYSDDYQLNVRVDGSLRNAFSLVALRYGIPIARIVELAAFLFVLAAEQSLERRRSKLAELEALFDRELELRTSFPHLPLSITPGFEADGAIGEEKSSIDARDIFGSRLSDNIFWRFGPVEEDYDAGQHNPFVTYLKEAASKFIDIEDIGSLGVRHASSYYVCREDAIKLAGGDEDLAEEILLGWVQLHEMPRDLLKDEATAERVKWMRSKVEAARIRHDEVWHERFREMGLIPSEGGTES